MMTSSNGNIFRVTGPFWAKIGLYFDPFHDKKTIYKYFNHIFIIKNVYSEINFVYKIIWSWDTEIPSFHGFWAFYSC